MHIGTSLCLSRDQLIVTDFEQPGLACPCFGTAKESERESIGVDIFSLFVFEETSKVWWSPAVH